MALTNTLLAKRTIDNFLRPKYTIAIADLQALGAFTTGTIILDTFPAGFILNSIRMKHSVAVVGAAGPITAATAQLQLVTQAASPVTTTLGPALNIFAAPGVLDGTSSITVPSSASGLGLSGTFVANGATPVTVANTNVALTDIIVPSLNTVGGTVGAIPRVVTITAGTGFTINGSASDTSTYNYRIFKAAGSGITVGDLEATTQLQVLLTEAGATIGWSDATAGSIDIWPDYEFVV